MRSASKTVKTKPLKEPHLGTKIFKWCTKLPQFLYGAYMVSRNTGKAILKEESFCDSYFFLIF